jgi:hypothetical protein
MVYNGTPIYSKDGLSHEILLSGPVLSRSSYMDSLIMYNTSIKTKGEVLNEFIKVKWK